MEWLLGIVIGVVLCSVFLLAWRRLAWRAERSYTFFELETHEEAPPWPDGAPAGGIFGDEPIKTSKTRVADPFSAQQTAAALQTVVLKELLVEIREQRAEREARTKKWSE